MAPATQQPRVVVQGLAELSRAFAAADRALSRELRKGLRDAAEPVKADAQTLALERIPHMTTDWSRMRVGVTRTSVYVAPRNRGSRSGTRKRRNLFDLIAGRSLEPALEDNVGDVTQRLDGVLATVGQAWDRA